jgi:ABC-2 type transport system permease protein
MHAFLTQLASIGFLCRKEFLALFKERSSRAILFVPVLMQALLYGYGATYDLSYAPYAVLDQSRGAASTELLARVDGTGVFKREASLNTPQQIAQVVDRGHVLLVLHFPADFDARLAGGQQAPLQMILDGRNSTTAGAAAAQVSAIVAAYNRSRTGTPAVSVERRAWYNLNLESRWNLMPALIAALSLIQTLLLSSLSVAREREQGTFDQLLVTPLTPMQILVGKAVPPMLVGWRKRPSFC